MTTNDPESGNGSRDGASQILMNFIPEDRKVSYLEIKDSTGLAGRDLDKALAALEKGGTVKSEHLPGGVLYQKAAPYAYQKWYTLDEVARYMRTSRGTL